MSYAGETLAEELADTEVEIRYGIDQKCEFIYANFNIVSVEDELEEVDAVIVTAVTFLTIFWRNFLRSWIVRLFLWKIFYMKFKTS